MKPEIPKDMTFLEAIEMGYIHQQGNWKDAPWCCNNRIMSSASDALKEANEQLKAHWANWHQKIRTRPIHWRWFWSYPLFHSPDPNN
nr:hypothetical protein [Providencia heimbachae]